MKIISKFHDYYDTALGYGVDETVVYIRKQETYDLYPKVKNLLNFPNHLPIGEFRIARGNSEGQRLRITSHILGFCGNIIPFVKLKVSDAFNDDATVYCYDIESIDNLMEKWGLADQFSRNKHHLTYIYYGAKRSSVLAFLNSGVTNLDIFFELGNPIFVSKFNISSQENVIVTNPCLKKYNFQTYMDPFSAFQEIDMFLSGVLGQAHPPITQISDKEMAKKKGFGHKYAFKKEPKK